MQDINTKKKWLSQSKHITIITIIMIFSISIAYSVLSISLKNQGSVVVKGSESMRFIGIENLNSGCGFDKFNYKNTDNTITINGELPNLECILEYKVTLINNTNVTMQVISINNDIYSNQDIIFTLIDLKEKDTIPPNTTITFNLVFEYNKSLTVLPDDTSIGAVIEFDWQEYIPIIPTIILDKDIVEIEYGNSYDFMEGIKAIDLADGDITENIKYDSTLNVDIVGRYEIIYSVINSFGESAVAIKTVNVVDKKKPIISVIGNNDQDLLINNTLDLKELINAYDEYDGDITNNVEIVSEPKFNNTITGTYKIYYNVLDSSNNNAETKLLTINVFEIIKVSSGSYHSLALTSHGKVYAWGQGTYGQLGQGNTSRKLSPTLISTLTNIVDIDAGEGTSFAVNSEGDIYSWGYNANYRLGHGDLTNRNVPTKITFLTSEKITQVSTSNASVAALTDNGYVYTWGYGGYGVLGNGNDTDQSKPIKIDISSVKSVQMGWYHGGALKENGELYLWGTNLEGQMALGNLLGYNHKPTLISELSNVKDFSCGGRHTLALMSNGDLYAWGYNDQGQLGDNSTSTRTKVTKILSSTQITSISAGYNSSIASEKESIYSWGYNIYGKLGLNDTTRRLIPTMNPYVSNAKYVTVGNNISFILTRNSLVYGMGYNTDGGIGDGTTQEKRIPTLWGFSY